MQRQYSSTELGSVSGLICSKSLQGKIEKCYSVCGQKAITARKLLTPPDYVMPFKKLHRFRITCCAYLGFSWDPQKRILTFMHTTPPCPVSTVGFILSVGTMKDK